MLPEDPSFFVPRMREKLGIKVLNLTEEAALQLVKLPLLHHDIFDRMMISQALHHDLTILSPDPLFSKYPVKVFW